MLLSKTLLLLLLSYVSEVEKERDCIQEILVTMTAVAYSDASSEDKVECLRHLVHRARLRIEYTDEEVIQNIKD